MGERVSKGERISHELGRRDAWVLLAEGGVMSLGGLQRKLLAGIPGLASRLMDALESNYSYMSSRFLQSTVYSLQGVAT